MGKSRQVRVSAEFADILTEKMTEMGVNNMPVMTQILAKQYKQGSIDTLLGSPKRKRRGGIFD